MAATTTPAGAHPTRPADPESPGIQRGAEWLLRSTAPDAVFTPEQLTEEHRLIGQTAAAFVDQEVLPQLDRLEQKDWDVARQLVRRSGELGLLGVDAAETYGGVGLDKVTSLIVSEKMARSASFGATFGAQSNLTIIPISLFGTDAQKQKYLPRLIGGEIIGAYGLSETGSGSDALGARTRAASQPDGSFVLNGEKMWITNGGFADLFVVFAKVDGEQFTAFLVERSAGVKSGKEEHKMGLHGSSTTALIFQDVKVPADAVLGEIGKGHKVAFNVLNFARFKLGAACEGGAQAAIAEAAKYAAERRQFGQPIASFGAIKHKIGEMVVRTYAIESLLYRTAGLVDQRIAATPHEAADGSAALAAFEEYAIEASIAKVAASEALDFVLDENIQIHGGNGYVRDYPAERHFRDARVNRIFEGTNEINRLLIPGMLARRAAKNELPIIAAAKALQEELLGPSSALSNDEGPSGGRAAVGRVVQEDRPDGLRSRAPDVRPDARRSAGSAHAHRGHHDGCVRGRERGVAGARGREPAVRARVASRRRRARLRERCGHAHRCVRETGARRHRRRRSVAHGARRAAPAEQNGADQHGGSAPADCG